MAGKRDVFEKRYLGNVEQNIVSFKPHLINSKAIEILKSSKGKSIDLGSVLEMQRIAEAIEKANRLEVSEDQPDEGKVLPEQEVTREWFE